MSASAVAHKPRNNAMRKFILKFVYTFSEKEGIPPCVREIMNAAGHQSISTTAGYLDRLVRDGYLLRVERHGRKYEVSPKGKLYIEKGELV